MPESQRRQRRHNRVVRHPSRRFLVEALEGRQLLAVFTVSNTNGDTSANSLYSAITASNATPSTPANPNVINFNLTGSGVHTIALVQGLPALTQPVTINGTSTGGTSVYNGVPLVEIDGTNASVGADGFDVTVPGVTIEGLTINNFRPGVGINLESQNTAPGQGDAVIACFIGTSNTGETAAPNFTGISVSGSSYNTIGVPSITVGGRVFSGGNVVSGNTFTGIGLSAGVSADHTTVLLDDHNLIQANFVGLDAAGTTALPNTDNGINLAGSDFNTIGGTTSGTANVISGGNEAGLGLSQGFYPSAGNLIEGNLIGTDKTGTVGVPSAGPIDFTYGISISSNDFSVIQNPDLSPNTIGGTASGARNVISSNNSGGINLFHSGPVAVFGNYIGLSKNGSNKLPNGFGISVSDSPNVTIGGTTPGSGNVISGNEGPGITISQTVATNSNGALIQGNYIGTDPTGNSAVPNLGDGITLASDDATIGGTTAGSPNVISGNTGNGITLNNVSNILIEGNLIGIAGNPATASILAVPNAYGIQINGGGNDTVGGTVGGAGNVISGNKLDGVHVSSSSGNNLFLGNYVGTDATGLLPVGNGGDGLYFQSTSNDVVGGTVTGAGNVISANGGHGIATGNSATAITNLLVEGNLIGTDATDNPNNPLGNSGDGVHLFSSGNTIGGTAAGAANVIAFNQPNFLLGAAGAGVQLVSSGVQYPTNNTILSNSIHDNAGLGIAFNANDVPTPNHPAGTAGPNDDQNYPVITSVIVSGGNTTIMGSLNGARASTYLIQFYDNPTEDPSGFGQGETLLGSYSVTTDSTGNVNFTVPPGTLTGGTVQGGDSISATATDASGNTSEFAQDFQAQDLADLSITGSADNSAVFVGQNVTYTFQVTNNGPDTAHNVTLVDTLPFNSTFVSSTPLGIGSVNGTTFTADLGSLLANTTTTVKITVRANQANLPRMVDTASVTTSDFDSSTPNTTTITTNVNPVVPLAVTITSSIPPTASAGVNQQVTYTLRVTNTSTATATNVILTDLLDPNETFVSGTLNTTPPVSLSTTTVGGATAVVSTIGTLAGGQSVTETIVVNPNASAINPVTDTGKLRESASVAYDQSASNPPPNNTSATLSTNVSPVIDLVVTYPSPPSPNPVTVGTPLTYTVQVTNNGPSTANNVVFTDSLDPNVTFTSGTWNQSTPVNLVANGNTINQPIGSLAAGASTTFTITVSPNLTAVVSPNASGTVTNTATATTSSEQDANPVDNTAKVTTTVNPSAVLTLQGTGPEASTIYAGQVFGYTFTVTNTGPSTANGVVITDPLPKGLTYVAAGSSVSTGGFPAQNGNTITAGVGTLAPGQNATVTINVMATGAAGGTSVVNTASATANEPPDNTTPSPVTAAVTTPITASADLMVTVSGTPGAVQVGSPLTYTIKVINNGPSDSTGSALIDTLDPDLGDVTILSQSSQFNGSATIAGDTLTAFLGTLKAGATATLTVLATPVSAGTVSNSAQITSENEFDPNSGNNSAQTSNLVTPAADLVATLTADPAAPAVVTTGQNLTYFATVTNNGPSTATNVVLTDTLPAGVSVVSIIPSAGGVVSQVGNVVTVNFSSLSAVNGSGSLTLVVSPTVAGPLKDSVVVSSADNEFDPFPLNNQASVTTTAVEPPGTLQFNLTVYAVNENEGTATIGVNRTGGAQGTVTVPYFTTTGSATPGVDYVPVAGVLTFQQGQTFATFTVPVLANPFDKQDELVGLQLGVPTGGAVLGTQSSALLVVRDIDPDVTPPQVSSLTWSGAGATIGSIVLTFSKELNPATATIVNNYHLVDAGRDSIAGTADDAPVTLSAAYYNPATFQVTLIPSFPLIPNESYHLDVNGTQPGAIADSAGNLLSGNGSGQAGSDYQTYIERGTNLSYIDASGNQVKLRLAGGGVLDLTRFDNGQGNVLQVVGTGPRRSTLSGSVRGGGRFAGTGLTSFNSILGLGRFGDVRSLLRTPPFYVANFPFVGATTAAGPATNVSTPVISTKAIRRLRGRG